MADAVPRRSFEWEIENPFLPPRVLEARFFSGSPTVTQWKATFQPMDRLYNYAGFSFSFESCQRPAGVVVEDLEVEIKLKDYVSREQFPTYHFGLENRFKYYKRGRIDMHPQTEPLHLTIKVQFYFPGEARRNEEEKNKLPEDDYDKKMKDSIEIDLRLLSCDLEKLFLYPQHPNMIIRSANTDNSFDVHSYILDARWDNFFEMHGHLDARVQNVPGAIFSPCIFEEFLEKPGRVRAWAQNVKETNISPDLLHDILTYIYSGKLKYNFPSWKNPEYTTELFQVMQQYELYHLYKNFGKSDYRQERSTRNSVLIESFRFPLVIVNDPPVPTLLRTLYIHLNSGSVITFQIRMRDENLNWLSYSMESNSESRIYAEVNLVLVKRREGEDEAIHFHWQACTLGPDSPVQSGPVQFSGCPETFGDSDSTGIEYFIRCFLHIVDGEKVETVKCLDDCKLPNELERFQLLSDDMLRMKNHPVDLDLRIISREGIMGDIIEYPIHKGIFAGRITNWCEGIENFERMDCVPDVARSPLTSDSLEIVHHYMYTGKVPYMTEQVFHEIRDFAEKTNFKCLLKLLDRIKEIEKYPERIAEELSNSWFENS